jgi:putative endonuclease
MYAEATGDVEAAIRREKQLKGWVRVKKLELIESQNPEWRDLGIELLGSFRDPSLRC